MWSEREIRREGYCVEQLFTNLITFMSGVPLPLVFLIVAVIGVGAGAYYRLHSGAEIQVNTAPVTRGEIVDTVGATGTLQLDDSSLFTGIVAGLMGADTIDLRDIGFANQPMFAASSAGGVLGLSDGVHSASIQLLGDYDPASFVASSDGHGGTSIALQQRLGA